MDLVGGAPSDPGLVLIGSIFRILHVKLVPHGNHSVMGGEVDNAMWRILSRQIAGIDEPRQLDDNEFAALLGRLEAFVEECGRVPERTAKEPDEARLGLWIEAQRRADHGGLLCPERRIRLEGLLGPRWFSRS